MDSFVQGFVKEAAALGLTELEALHIFKIAHTRPKIVRPTFTRPDIQKPSINRPGELDRPNPDRPPEVTPPTPPDRPPDIQPGPAMNRPPDIMRPKDVNVSLISALHPKEVNDQLDELATPKVASKIDWSVMLKKMKERRGEVEKTAIYIDATNLSSDHDLPEDRQQESQGNNFDLSSLSEQQMQMLLQYLQQMQQQKTADYKSDVALEQGPNPFTGVKHNKYDIEYEGKRIASIYHKLRSKKQRSAMYAEPHYENMPELKNLLQDLVAKHPEIMAKLNITPLGSILPHQTTPHIENPSVQKTGGYKSRKATYEFDKISKGLQPDMSKFTKNKLR